MVKFLNDTVVDPIATEVILYIQTSALQFSVNCPMTINCPLLSVVWLPEGWSSQGDRDTAGERHLQAGETPHLEDQTPETRSV